MVGGGKGSCRFCGTTANTSLLAIGSVCTDPECLERSDVICDKTLPCGHACCGVKGEEKCLPCLNGCAGDDSKLKQDAEDMCMMCYTEGLAYAACIQVTIKLIFSVIACKFVRFLSVLLNFHFAVQLECGHLFHYHCCRNALTTRWSGPRILFRFMFCPLCTVSSTDCNVVQLLLFSIHYMLTHTVQYKHVHYIMHNIEF